jgi:predicted HicB family RNase H-like nuclease
MLAYSAGAREAVHMSSNNSSSFTFTCTKEQRDRYNQAASALNLSLNRWVRQAVEDWTESRDLGFLDARPDPMPPGDRVHCVVRLDPELQRQAKRLAATENRSLSALLREGLDLTARALVGAGAG